MIIDIRIDTKKDNINKIIEQLSAISQKTTVVDNVKPVVIRKKRKWLSEIEKEEIKVLVASGEKRKDVAHLYDVSYSTVCRIA